MINVKYPRRGFVVEEVTEGCKTEGCSVKKLVVVPWEYYGEHDFNELTEGITVGQNTCDDDNEGECKKCGKPVYFKRHFIVTSDASDIKTAEDAVAFAYNVLKAPFPEGEALIATSVDNSYRYARWVLNAPFSLGEKIIATDPFHSYHYAKDILHAPFPLGEAAIATDAHNFKMYKELFPEPQAAPEPQAPTIEEPQAPDSMNIVSGFYLEEKSSISDKKQDVIKSTFLTLVYTLEDIIDYDQQGGTYHFVGSLFDADRILQSINDLMETFPELTRDLAEEKYPKVKSYMDEYSKKRKEKHEKEKTRV